MFTINRFKSPEAMRSNFSAMIRWCRPTMNPSYTCCTYCMKSCWAFSLVSRRLNCCSSNSISRRSSSGIASRPWLMAERYYTPMNLSTQHDMTCTRYTTPKLGVPPYRIRQSSQAMAPSNPGPIPILSMLIVFDCVFGVFFCVKPVY